VPQSVISVWFFWASALALGLGYVLFAWVVSGKFGSVIRAIRDNEARVRFLGYNVEGYKLFVFTLTAIVSGIAGRCITRKRASSTPPKSRPSPAIYLAVWVAIGGRGRLYGAVIGAARCRFVQLADRRGGPQYRPGFLPHRLDGLVAGAAGSGLCRGHAVLSQGHRRAVRPAGQETAMNTLLEVQACPSPLTGFAPSTTCPLPSASLNCAR
jgi:ABC-type branched-subunit amino acid transport system permease subunit